MKKLLALAVPILVLSAATARGDEILLDSGGRVTGRILFEDDEAVTIEVSGGIVSIRWEYVLAVTHGPSLVSEYYERSEKLEGCDDVEARFELAEWASRNRLHRFCRDECRRIVAREPDHFGARRLLGHRFYDGRWMTRKEFKAATAWRNLQ